MRTVLVWLHPPVLFPVFVLVFVLSIVGMVWLFLLEGAGCMTNKVRARAAHLCFAVDLSASGNGQQQLAQQQGHGPLQVLRCSTPL
jgi:hypothetical protein